MVPLILTVPTSGIWGRPWDCQQRRPKWTPIKNDTEMWPYIGRISYHVYGTADPYRSYIRDLGQTMGLPTAQTEMDPNKERYRNVAVYRPDLLSRLWYR